MRISLSMNREQGLTLVELFVVMAIIACFAIFFISQPDRNMKARALRIQCVNNQKQVGLATRVWAGDHGDKYPASISATNGGSLEFVGGTDEWRYFLVMSNELSTPRVLLCPADDSHLYAATNFTFLRNSNISFFLGVDVADGSNPQMILGGDCNVTNGTQIKNGILRVSTNNPAGWTSETHNKSGIYFWQMAACNKSAARACAPPLKTRPTARAVCKCPCSGHKTHEHLSLRKSVRRDDPR